MRLLLHNENNWKEESSTRRTKQIDDNSKPSSFGWILFTKGRQLAEKARCVFDKDNKINTDDSEIVAKHHWCGSWWQDWKMNL